MAQNLIFLPKQLKHEVKLSFCIKIAAVETKKQSEAGNKRLARYCNTNKGN